MDARDGPGRAKGVGADGRAPEEAAEAYPAMDRPRAIEVVLTT